jgi:hypothetical protein
MQEKVEGNKRCAFQFSAVGTEAFRLLCFLSMDSVLDPSAAVDRGAFVHRLPHAE